MTPTMTHSLRRYRRVARPAAHTGWVPPRWVEYTYFASLFYAIFGEAWGVSIPLAGAGMLMLLAAFCLSRQGVKPFTSHSSIALPLYCAMSFLVIQVVAHGGSLLGNRDFIIWMLSLIVIQALCRRPGFLHRFVMAMLLFGAMALPYLQFRDLGVERMSVERMVGGNLGNPNGLAEWFGFCAIYLVIVGIETKRITVRTVSWLGALGCLYLIGLTVSRGALLAVAAASVMAFRHSLKRAFLPVLGLIIGMWIAYELGVFAKAVALYETRGMEESGRLLVWPLVWARFLNSPLMGVGASDVYTFTTGTRAITPHNGFLFLALASGIIPLALYVAYWCQAGLRAIRSRADRREESPFHVPLLTFVFLAAFASNTTFMVPWAILTFCMTMLPGASRQGRWMAVRRNIKSSIPAAVGRPVSDHPAYKVLRH